MKKLWYNENTDNNMVMMIPQCFLWKTAKLNPFPNDKEFADDNSKFDDNVRKFYKQVGNTVQKVEIAHY